MISILKWLATGILIVGTAINSMGIFPLGAFVLAAGAFAWLIVAVLWREPAMIVTNAVLGSVGIGCLAYSYLIT
jgi:hypothetical protein